MGYIIFIIAALFISFSMNRSVVTARREAYLECNDLTEEERREESSEASRIRLVTLIGYIAYGLFAAAAFLGNSAGIILAGIFTVAAIVLIYVDASDSSKSRVKYLACLIIPAAVVVCCALCAGRQPFWGIVVGLALVIGVFFAPQLRSLVGKNPMYITDDEPETDNEPKANDTPKTDTETSTASAKPRTRRPNASKGDRAK